MKNLVLLLLIFISSFSYSQKLKTFVHPTDGFEIGIPRGWGITNNSKCSLLVHSSKDSIGGTIIIHKQPSVDTNFDIIYEDYVRTIKVNKTVHDKLEPLFKKIAATIKY